MRGVYAMGVMNPSHIDDYKPVALKVMGGKRDLSGVVVEFWVHGVHTHFSSGGIEQDEEVVRAGKICHMKTGTEDRWCFPRGPHQLQSAVVPQRLPGGY